MEKNIAVLAGVFLTLWAASCNFVREEASNTPIGSVISGETSDADSYIRRVERDNRNLDRDTWRPQNNDR